MSAFFLIPLSAFLADLMLLLTLRKRTDAFGRLFLILAAFLGSANLLLVFQLISTDEQMAGSIFHAMRHALFPVPVLLLGVSLLLAGRKLRSFLFLIPVALLFGFLILINITFFSGNALLVSGMRLHPFGFFPVLNMPGLLLLSSLFGSCFLLSMIVLLQRKDSSPVSLNRRMPALLFVWWLGFALNMITLSGHAFPPMGMAVDALICILFASHLISSEDRLFRLSEMLGSLSAGALGGTLALLLLPSVSESVRIIAFLTASVPSVLLWTRMIQRPSPPLTGPLLASLTKQELRICELILEGYNRKQISFFLGVTDGTLRNHLMNIYAKALNGDDGRDRFQRLTVFLQKHDARHTSSAHS